MLNLEFCSHCSAINICKIDAGYVTGVLCFRTSSSRGKSLITYLVSLFVCWVIYFQSQIWTDWTARALSPEVALILAANLRYTRLRDPDHPRLANR